MRLVLFLLLSASPCSAQRDTGSRGSSLMRDEARRVAARGCSNLTQVLDNWEFAIVSRVKGLLVHQHSTLLPQYSRIPVLSDALQDLYREFNKLKENLVELTARFGGVEALVDGLHPGMRPKASGPGPLRRRKVIRRVLRKKVASQRR